MKNISLTGLLLGLLMAAAGSLLSGSWVFWLAVGIAIGVLLGAAMAKRSQPNGMTHSGAA
jgi:hypothetical protein